MKYIQFKGLFRDVPFWSQLVLFLFLLIFSSLTFLLLGELFLNLFSIENRITRLEINQLFSAIGMFIIAPLAISYLFSYHPFQFLSLNRPNIKLVLLALLCFITSIPFVNYITVLNESMHFPSFLSGIEDWMRTMEEKNGKLTLDMLSGNNWYEILLDIIVLALIPAIGEELLFRGAIQNGLYKLTFLNNEYIKSYSKSRQLEKIENETQTNHTHPSWRKRGKHQSSSFRQHTRLCH